jgi:hypothetical protein
MVRIWRTGKGFKEGERIRVGKRQKWDKRGDAETERKRR